MYMPPSTAGVLRLEGQAANGVDDGAELLVRAHATHLLRHQLPSTAIIARRPFSLRWGQGGGRVCHGERRRRRPRATIAARPHPSPRGSHTLRVAATHALQLLVRRPGSSGRSEEGRDLPGPLV